jgi:hypothetical protein
MTMRNNSVFAFNERLRRKGTRRIHPILATLLGFVAVTLLPAIVVAEERTCRGELRSVTVDNLRVPDGASCTLNRTQVKGTIKVESRASLNARGVHVVSNVQAENARQVSVTQSSRIGGSVQVKQGGSASVLNSTVQGDIQYDANRSSLRVNDNRVGGNVQVIGNQARAEIYGNRIDGNLQCKENRPRPVGGNNRVQGNKEDQCSAF